MSIDTPPSPVPADAEALLAAAEGKGDKEIRALVARVVIDALGRPWDPLKHPRDAEGKFIETFAEVRALFRTPGGGTGAPRVSGRVVAFDHNGDVWVRVDHVADGYTDHKPGDLVPIKPDDIQAMDKLASIPKSLDGEQRTQIEALAARMEGRNPDAAAALHRAADPGNNEPIAQLADLHEARDALDADGSPDAVAVRDLVWDLSDQLGDHPSNDEVIKAAQGMVRDHLAKNPTQNAEAIARLDRDIHAEAPPAQPSAPDAAQVLAGQLHKVADRIQDVNPADAVHVRNVAAALGDVGMTGETPDRRDARLEKAAVTAAKIKNVNLRKKIIADIKHMRENPPENAAPAPERADNEPKARLNPPSAAEPLPPVQTPGPDVPATPPVPEAPQTPQTPEATDQPVVTSLGIQDGEAFVNVTPYRAQDVRGFEAEVEEWTPEGAYGYKVRKDGEVGGRKISLSVPQPENIKRAFADLRDQPDGFRGDPAQYNAPGAPEARVTAPSAPPDAADTPTTASPDEPDELTPDDLEAETVEPAAPEAPAAAAFPQAGDLSPGLQWENHPEGMFILGRDAYGHRELLKSLGAKFLPVPGHAPKRDGQPFKGWAFVGNEDRKIDDLKGLASRLGLDEPGMDAVASLDEEYPPTPQQQDVIDAVYTGKDVVVRALAGTGKTSTLRMLARRLLKSDPGKRIVYVAFNKSIQEEAQKTMPSNVEARTGDSIAYATMSDAMKGKLKDKSLLRRNKDIADFLGIRNNMDIGGGQPPLSPEEQAMRVMRAIEKYSISADDEISPKHFEGLPNDVAINLLPYAQKAWADITSDKGRIRTTFSHFTKMWALSRPDFTSTTSGLKRKADIIFFDEAQDINPVMAKVIADQKIQKVYVGDGNQAIYGFRGAEDQLDKVKAEHDLPLTKSWRFGPQIASMGNRFLALLGSKHRIEGAGPEGKIDAPYTMTDPDAILVRSNAGAIGEILQAQTDGKLVGVPKGTKGDLSRLVDTARWLQQGGRPPEQVHDDLAAFRTWDEVRKAAEAGDDPKVKMLYNIVEDNGIPALTDLVSRLIDTSDKGDLRTPDLIVTTAHKAKGLEWDKVKIGGDFRGPRIDKQTGDLIMPSPEEMRLAYVAVTRAQKELDPGSLAWVYDYTDENGGTVKPETPTPAPEPPVDLPSSPTHRTTPTAEPGTPETGPDTTPPTPPAPEAEIPASPEAPPADYGDVPDGWEQGKDPYDGKPNDTWRKGDYTVFTGRDNGAPGLRIAEFDKNAFPVWKADADDWADVERQIAAHEDIKANGGLEQKDRDAIAATAERLGLGNDVVDAIKSGTPDQIEAALLQDEKYNELRSGFQDAIGADAWNADQKKAFEDWTALNNDVLLKLMKARLFNGDARTPQDAQEAPDTRTPAAPEVPTPQPEIPAYSGEQRPIQPRDLGEIVNAVDDAQRWLEGYYQDNYIRPGNDGEQKAFDAVKEALGNVGDAVREGNFDNAQVNLDALRSEIEREGVEPQFRDDMSAYVDQIQGVLDKVNQRDKGQFEIPGVAQPSAAPYAEHAAPELNAAFDDMLDTNPDAAKNLKDLRQALEYFHGQVEHDNEYEQTVRQVIEAINNHDYQGALEKLNDVLIQPQFPADTDPYADQPERYSDFGGYNQVEDAASRVVDDWAAMEAAQAPAAPDVPASQEPLAEWEKELLNGWDQPAQMTPDMVDAADERQRKLAQWQNVVAELDGQVGGEEIGGLYNEVIQDGRLTDPGEIENAVQRIRAQFEAEGDQPALNILDQIIRDNAPGPQSDVPGPYDPAANPEVVLPDVPGDGTPIKDERRVIDPRVRGEIEDVKRGVGLPELPDRLDIDRNGAAVFALDLVDVPAAGKQGKGDRRRPPGIGQIRRIYTKNGVRYAEVAFYDPAFVDYPNRNAAKARQGIKNNSPFYVWDGIRVDKIQKVDGDNPDAVSFLGHLGPEEARQYAGRNAGRLAQNRGRVRPELERMANLKYIGDRYAADADGLMVGKGDVVLYNGKKYEVARVNHNPDDNGNTRLDLIPIGDDGAPELQAGGKHAEPYARMVRFYDQPLGDRQIGVTTDELKDLVRRLDANGKYIVGQPLRDALDGGDLKEVARAFNEDPAILDYVADGRAYINDYIQRLLNANLRGDFKGIDRHEQEMVRKDKNDLLNAMAAVDGRFLEGTGQDRHIRREIPGTGPDQEYKGNQPEVLMPLRYAQVKALIDQRIAENPGEAGIWDGIRNAVVHAGQINLDQEDDFNRVFGAFNALRRAADATGGVNDPELAKALGDLQDAMTLWHDDQAKRKAMVQGGPGGEARLPGGRTVAPGLVRPPGKSNVPAPQNDDDRAYADKLGNDADARARYQRIREALDQASSDVRAEHPGLADYLDEANRALIAGDFGEAFHAVDNLISVPVGHPNYQDLAEWQAALVRADHYAQISKALLDINREDWPNRFFPNTSEINAGKAPAAPAAPAVPNSPLGRYDEPDVRRAFYDFAMKQLVEGKVDEANIPNGDLGTLRDALNAYVNGGMRALTPSQQEALHAYVGQVDYRDADGDPGIRSAWDTVPGRAGERFLDQLYDALGKTIPGAPDEPAAPAAPNAPAVGNAENLKVGDIWVVENADDLGAAHPGIGEWRIQAVDAGDTANRYRVERVGGKGAFGDNADAYIRHGQQIKIRPAGGAPAAPDNRAEIDQTNPVHNIVNFFERNPYGDGNLAERQAIRDAVQAWNDGNAPTPEDRKLVRDYLVKRAEVEDDPALKQNMNDWINYFDRGASPAAPAAPAVPQKPAVDMPDHMRAMLKGKGDRFIRPEAKDAADALNAGMAPNALDLEALHEDVQKRIDHYEAQGDRPGKVAEYQEVKDWLDAYAPRPGAGPAEPASPAAPREAANIRQAVADAVEAKYEELRADRKNNEARKKALDIQEQGDLLDGALDQAIGYHGSDNPDDVDTRNTSMRYARDAVQQIRAIDPALADQLDSMLAELAERFSRDDDNQLAQRYLDEAQKYHDADTPDNDQRERMIRAAQDQIARIRRDDPTKADEFAARLAAMVDKFNADDIERARAKPVGRTKAIDEFDAAVEAERKRLRDEKKNAEARALAKDAENVAEALNDAEDAHKAGNTDERDAAIEKARAAAEELDKKNPDLAEIARRAVEGNAARFAHEDARGAGGADVVPGGEDTQEGWDLVNRAAEDFRGISLYEAKRRKKVGDWEYVRSLKSGINDIMLFQNSKTGEYVVLKYDDDGTDYGHTYYGNGAAAEEMVARLYRDLGFNQPAAVLINPGDPDMELGGMIAMNFAGDGAWGLEDFETIGGGGRLRDFAPEDHKEVFLFVMANGIIGNTDRHGGNLMWARDSTTGKRRIVVIDNGLAMLNGGFGDAHSEFERGNALALRPDLVIRGAYGNRNTLLGAARDYRDAHPEARSELEVFARRMQERARLMKFYDQRAYAYVEERAQWVLDHLDDYLNGLG